MNLRREVRWLHSRRDGLGRRPDRGRGRRVPLILEGPGPTRPTACRFAGTPRRASARTLGANRMRPTRPLGLLCAAALLAPMLATDPAAAVPAPGNGCTSNATSGAVMAWYPANPGSVSRLQVSCVLRDNPGADQISPSFTLHDMVFAQYHNGSVRKVDVQPAGAGATVLVATTPFTGTGLGAWQNRMITGPGISAGTFVTSVNDATSTLNLNRPTAGFVSGEVKIENAPSARWLTDASYVNASTITSPTGNFTFQDIDHSISGAGFAPNTVISGIGGGGTTANVSPPLTAGSIGSTVSIGEKLNYRASGIPYGPSGLTVTTTRSVSGATTTGNTITSSVAQFQPTDIGLAVRPALPVGTCAAGPSFSTQYIVGVTSATTATVSPGTLPTDTCDIVIGDTSPSSPADGSVMLHQAVQLNISPVLIPDVDDCAANRPETVEWIGTWHNPGSFTGNLSSTSIRQPGWGTAAGQSKAIGQIYVDVGAAELSMFVLERESGTPAPNGTTDSYPTGLDPIGTRHYDLVVPYWVAKVTMCPGTATSTGLSFTINLDAITIDQSIADPLTRRPGTNQVRNVIHRPTATPGYNGTTYATSDLVASGNQWTPTSAFSRLCVYPSSTPAQVNFQCGAG